MNGKTGARWGGWLVLALLLLGWAVAAVPARADEPAKKLSDEERGKLEKEMVELNNKAVRMSQDGQFVPATELMALSLEVCRNLYPPDKYPDGHPELGTRLSNLGFLLQMRGEYDKAEPFLRDALDMRKKLYPPDKYSDGHPDLATSLNNLGELLQARGEYGKAEPFLRDALDMRKKLYPPEKYPDGHPDLTLSLNNLGGLLYAQGAYGKAEPFFHDALDVYRRLYPPDKYPRGHPDLARSLNNLGALLEVRGEYGKAEPYDREALDMCKRLYPPEKFSDGHPALAMSLNNLGLVLDDRGEYGKAEPYYRAALDMYKRLYPPEKFPNGHPALATSLNDLGALLRARGEYGKAELYCRDALDMNKKLYPVAKYPDGHPDLARSLNNLGALLQDEGEYDKAEPFLRNALDMRKKLYPSEKHPDGHPDLAVGLTNLGSLLGAQGQYGKAEPFVYDALDMNKRLYPPDKYPDGHPDLARSLNNLGALLEAQGEYTKAALYYRDALHMYKGLYPPVKYPDGHPDLAKSLSNLGLSLMVRRKYASAADALAKGAAMYDRLTTAFAETGAEAEALNLAASVPTARNAFLAATRNTESADPADQYPVLWQGKSALARGLQRRRRLLRAAAEADAATRRKIQALVGVRENLARLILAPARPGDADRAQLVQELTDKKESLEKELASLLPTSDRQTPPYTDLRDRLPGRAAFIDIFTYSDWDTKNGKRDTGHYAAFVVRKGQPVRRVELTDGATIEKDLASWRRAIARGIGGETVSDADRGLERLHGDGDADAAGRLRRSVWEPIAKLLGDDADTVFLCPDGPLSALPWSALPGDRANSVLLEKYTFALVPSGPFLLEQLMHPTPPDRTTGALLAVGGVLYDRPGTPADKAGRPWPNLAATDKERAVIVDWAKKLPAPPEVMERSGADADVGQLLKDLPKARWAHFATHGFFAAPKSGAREHLFQPEVFLMGGSGERRGAAARNPLALSGLVLAGANQPSESDAGILSGEALAGLDLDGLDLAVLSACETGLGEQSSGEGVFGLQRAFHIGGARNVVASLWTVDDAATAALMNLFYYHLWKKGEPPLRALHEAQLELYRNPQGIKALARGRSAVDWDEVVEKAVKPPADAKPQARPHAPIKDWAAFMLSGAGR